MATIMASCIPLFSQLSAETQLLERDLILCETKNMRLVAPCSGLSHDSVRIENKKSLSRFIDWSAGDHEQSYELIQKVASIWQKRDIDDYLVIGRNSLIGDFSWDIIPFPKDQQAFWKQLNVMKRVFFGEMKIEPERQEKTAGIFYEEEQALNAPFHSTPGNSFQGTDVFCHSSIIDKQKIIDKPDETIRILYDYKPITYYHFLAVPKQHAEKFSEVSIDSYLKAASYAKELIRQFGSENSNVYLYHKTGKRAGQTVPHWHQHIVIANTNQEETYGKIKVFYNMIWGASPLKQEELSRRVDLLRKEVDSL